MGIAGRRSPSLDLFHRGKELGMLGRQLKNTAIPMNCLFVMFCALVAPPISGAKLKDDIFQLIK